MTGSVKPQCGAGGRLERQVWADLPVALSLSPRNAAPARCESLGSEWPFAALTVNVSYLRPFLPQPDDLKSIEPPHRGGRNGVCLERRANDH